MLGRDQSCKKRIGAHYKDRVANLRLLFEAYQANYDRSNEYKKVAAGENCPCCGKLKSSVDESTGICKACWEKLEDETPFEEYGLSFDYVAPGTFKGQKQGYFRYQLSWGGPSDEFRFFVNPDQSVYKIEYWFLDWWDGSHKTLSGADEQLLESIFDWFESVGSVQAALEADR